MVWTHIPCVISSESQGDCYVFAKVLVMTTVSWRSTSRPFRYLLGDGGHTSSSSSIVISSRGRPSLFVWLVADDRCWFCSERKELAGRTHAFGNPGAARPCLAKQANCRGLHRPEKLKPKPHHVAVPFPTFTGVQRTRLHVKCTGSSREKLPACLHQPALLTTGPDGRGHRRMVQTRDRDGSNFDPENGSSSFGWGLMAGADLL
jgi:hypothetical protein